MPDHAIIGDIRERMAEGRQLPVEHADHARLARMIHEVLQPEVAVGDGRPLVARRVCGKPADQLVHRGNGMRLGGLVLPRPQRDLPGEVAGRLAEAIEPHRAPVDRMQVGHDLAHGGINGAALGRRQAGQCGVAEHAAFGEIHHIEWGADNRSVLAQQAGRDDRHTAPLQRMHDAVFALDHVRRWQQLPRRLLAQHVTPPPTFHNEGRVGLTAAELANGKVCGKTVEVLGEIVGEPVGIELVSRADISDFGRTHGILEAVRVLRPSSTCPINGLLNCRTKIASVKLLIIGAAKAMNFEYSAKTLELVQRCQTFMCEFVYPNEHVYAEQHAAQSDCWVSPPIMEELKSAARQAGLWNLFLPESEYGAGLSNLEYAPVCEIMGRSPIAPEVFNCAAPDTGNMEVLVRYGTEEQKRQWLVPLLAGEIRSGFAMTEPDVASSDARNIQARIERDGDHYVINGRKWWTSGAGDRRCRILIVMGKTNPTAETYRQQSMILVPMDTPGVTPVRPLTVFGYNHAPHGHMEITFQNVRVPATNMLLGEGRGFEIAQGRLGPGRIHHCMRAIGLAERALESMVARAKTRHPFGKPMSSQGMLREAVALSRMEIDQARLLTLKAAHMMDTVGNKAARAEIAMIKVVAPRMAQAVLDRAVQVHGGGGVSGDFGLAAGWALTRTLRLADGPDEVHIDQIARIELAKDAQLWT
jgi:acyl-CoA dehydrogenase